MMRASAGFKPDRNHIPAFMADSSAINAFSAGWSSAPVAWRLVFSRATTYPQLVIARLATQYSRDVSDQSKGRGALGPPGQAGGRRIGDTLTPSSSRP